MSDDGDDERMERARRIRRMREGQRESGGDGDADGEDEASGDAETAVQAGSDSGTGAETGGGDAVDDTGIEAETGGGDAVDDTGIEAETGGGDATGDDGGDGQPPQDDTGRTESEPAGNDGGPSPTDGPEPSDGRAETRSDGNGSGAQDREDAVEDETMTQDQDTHSATESNDDAVAAARRVAQAAGDAAGGTATQQASATDESGGDIDAPLSDPDAAAGTVELPDQSQIEDAVDEDTGDAEEATPAAPGVDAEETTVSEQSVRVLEFALGGEYYCLDIEHVEEIVKRDTITRVPNTDDYVEGVVDLRGQITTILEPKELLDIDGEGPEELIVVFDPEAFEDQGALGWVVDQVRQVVPVTESQVNEPPVEGRYIEGVVDREDEEDFVIWVDPEVAIREAAGGTSDDG